MINKQANDLVHNHGFKPDVALQHALIADAMFRDALADEYQWLDEYYDEYYKPEPCTAKGTPHSVVHEIASDVLPEEVVQDKSVDELAKALNL